METLFHQSRLLTQVKRLMSPCITGPSTAWLKTLQARWKLEKKEKKQAKITFEEALAELEVIASQLEEGTLGLDDSITRFEKGITLARFCHEKLEEAERKIEILQKGESSKIKKKEVRVKEDSGEIEDDEDVQGSLL